MTSLDEAPIVLWLPFPPTVNAYWKAVKSRLYLSTAARKYKETVERDVKEQAPDVRLEQRLLIEVHLFPPDQRPRDLDNYMKGLLDALTSSGIWKDDSQIDQLLIFRGRSGSGKVRVEICDAGPVLPEPQN